MSVPLPPFSTLSALLPSIVSLPEPPTAFSIVVPCQMPMLLV